MAAARMTQAQARALLAGRTTTTPDEALAKTKAARRTKQPYHTECVLDGERFTSAAAEDRHFRQTGHPRYALVLTLAEEEPK